MNETTEFVKRSIQIYVENRKSDGCFYVSEIIPAITENAVREFGLMAGSVCEYWGIREASDIEKIIGEIIEKNQKKLKIKFKENRKLSDLLNPKEITLRTYSDYNIKIEYVLKNGKVIR